MNGAVSRSLLGPPVSVIILSTADDDDKTRSCCYFWLTETVSKSDFTRLTTAGSPLNSLVTITIIVRYGFATHLVGAAFYVFLRR